MGPQLQLVSTRGGRLALRRRPPSRDLQRLAAHLHRVRGYQPYPELLVVAATALDLWLGAKGEEQREAVRAEVLRLPSHVRLGRSGETTVGAVVEHLELAAFASGGDVDGLGLRVAAEAWGRP